ncbi:MAG: FKBP-type peptidyl-prolyl cis-trans isomerase [Gammaproteobacteria bacterium]|nr:FKBP-type peptidyl-prolyl cis-trans isomerase [Gammaproteobacteria bacterium]
MHTFVPPVGSLCDSGRIDEFPPGRIVFQIRCQDGTTPPSVGLDVPFSIEDLMVGTGQEAMNGDALSANYAGWLYDPNAAENKGTQFDSGNLSFTLGAGQVIGGWDQGLLGMRVGGRRRIVIPPELGYGDSGAPPAIPGDATLLFEVELLGIS